MGVFYDRVPTGGKTVKQAVAEALQTQPPPADEIDETAEEKAAEVAPPGYAKFNVGRFVGALVLWGLIVAAAIGAEERGLERAIDGLWAAAAIVFGVVVGFLAGERSAA